jgi:cation diffusion facilitator family transporter
MRMALFFGVIIMLVKFSAWFFTHSNAILTDTLESIINVLAGSFALYSLYLSSLPQDENHPYGHGKIEFVSAGFEGALIVIAGGSMVYKGVFAFFEKPGIHSLELGILISIAGGLANFFIGNYLIREGKKLNTQVLIADGKHLYSDALTSAGLVFGLCIMYFTQWFWLDAAITIVFGIIIVYTGIKLAYTSITSLLDEADYELLQKLSEILNRERKDSWIDFHNMRILKYGSRLHFDGHITLPFYFGLEDAHQEIKELENSLRKNLQNEMEFFIHADPCLPPSSCCVCRLQCPRRKAEKSKEIEWNLKTLLPDSKHFVD